MIKPLRMLTLTTLLTAGSFSLPWLSVARADRCANVYLVQNQLYANQQSQERAQFEEAVPGRRIDPEDEVYADGQTSIGALLFDRGSLVRVSGTSNNRRNPFSFESDASIETIVADSGLFIKNYLTLEGGGRTLVMIPASVDGDFMVKTDQGIIQVTAKADGQQAALIAAQQGIPLASQIACHAPQVASSELSKAFEVEAFPTFLTSNSSKNIGSGLELAQTLDVERKVLSLFEQQGQATALYIAHNAERNTTEVFALTGNGQIQVSNLANGNLANGERQITLSGGQTVDVSRGTISEVEEFDIETFLDSNNLAYGLPLNQSGTDVPSGGQISQDHRIRVLSTIGATRNSIGIAIKAQKQRLRGFRADFLRDALGGDFSQDDFDGHVVREGRH